MDFVQAPSNEKYLNRDAKKPPPHNALSEKSNIYEFKHFQYCKDIIYHIK